MSTSVVQNLASEFLAECSAPMQKSAHLALDGSWPSVGVVDLLLSPLRGRKELPENAVQFLRQASAYLSLVITPCWQVLGQKPVCRVGKEGFVIESTGTDGWSVALEQCLRDALSNPEKPVPFSESFSQIQVSDHGIVTELIRGLVLGTSPLIRRNGEARTAEVQEQEIAQSLKLLAMSCADWGERVFPKQQLAHVAELYLHDLLYPPMFMNESLPALSAAQGLIKFSQEMSIPSQKLAELCACLSSSPDEMLSVACLAVYCALTEASPAESVVAIAQGKGPLMGLLRQTILVCREQLGKSGDWIGAEQPVENLQQRVETEFLLGLLPWLRLPASRVGEAKFQSLLFMLSTFDFQASVAECRRLVDDEPGDIDLRVQQIELDLIGGDFDRCEAEIRKVLSEPQAATLAMLYAQWATCDKARSDLASAVKHAERAYQRSSHSTMYAPQILNDYAWLLLAQNRAAEALPIFDEALHAAPGSLIVLLNKAYALFQLRRPEEFAKIRERLVELAPTNLKVFSNEVLSELNVFSRH